MNNKKNKLKKIKRIFFENFDRFRYSFNEYKNKFDFDFFKEKFVSNKKQVLDNKNQIQKKIKSSLKELNEENFSKVSELVSRKSNLYKRFLEFIF